ncbi:MAG: hypothetical protein A2469_03620 [Candidatus Magasanikbacteria bacterium RIFOXYC2_FULL_40_16]|uniref:Mutator family transposase n=1 Tax=Candidatus Magasanikbacteria bacterium RIFOXYC2_FULL_40_16 TaxID=1798703 RepID=A0A1F6P2B1_9BACT|nr:MAG: hypothetical protein A2469_03620 [Candidatus Magasanikbacteria bacterium RIFOXYC2_FULL_40_16]
MATGRIDNNIGRQIVRESLERASIRILARRYNKTTKTIMMIIHRLTACLPLSTDIAKKFQPLWSGILVFDGKVVRVYDQLFKKMDQSKFTDDEKKWKHKMRWLCGVDFGTGDLPHYDLGESENMIDLVMYFKTLKSIKYPLVALVCDGNPLIPKAAKFVFGKQLIAQRCTRHFLEDLRRLLPTEETQKEERTKLEQLILCIKFVIEADSLESAQNNLEILKKYSATFKSPAKHIMLGMFKRSKIELTAHLLNPELKLPHTSNDIENLFKQLMLRLKSLGRFYHQDYARNYLNGWALLRRFTPFTDCRNGRKHRNKKSPIELAGCEIKNIDPLKLER